jgi:ABC-type dipeptide/oligopeptide/nickel transport system permease component
MLSYLGRRMLVIIPTMVVVLFVVFVLCFYGPGDPIKLRFYMEYNTWDLTRINIERHNFGLDRPLLVQFGDYLVKFARGDFGVDFARNPIGPRLQVAIPVSIQLGLAAAVLVFLIGVPLGIVAALRSNTTTDYLIVGGTLVLRTIPVFVLAPLLMILFVLELKVLKVGWGWRGPFQVQSILPIILMALGPLAVVIRQTRAGILEVLSQDYVRTARAKGLTNRLIVLRHIMPNAMLPVITSFGLIVEGLVIGSVFLERVFAIPGFGNITTTAIQSRDFPTILACTMFSSLAIILSNLLVDVLYPFLDPRVTLE